MRKLFSYSILFKIPIGRSDRELSDLQPGDIGIEYSFESLESFREVRQQYLEVLHVQPKENTTKVFHAQTYSSRSLALHGWIKGRTSLSGNPIGWKSCLQVEFEME